MSKISLPAVRSHFELFDRTIDEADHIDGAVLYLKKVQQKRKDDERRLKENEITMKIQNEALNESQDEIDSLKKEIISLKEGLTDI